MKQKFIKNVCGNYSGAASLSLILTVCLLLFSGCQGSITAKATADLSCTMDINFKVLEINGEEMVCESGSAIELTIENLGTGLAGLIIKTEALGGSFEYRVNQSIAQGATAKVSVPYDKGAYDEIVQMRIIPVMKSKAGMAVGCIQKQNIIDLVKKCR